MNLGKKEAKSLSVISQAIRDLGEDKVAVAWTGGKDSTVLLHLVRRYFEGRILTPVWFNDSTMEFEEIYRFTDKLKNEWKIPLIVQKHSSKELKQFRKTKDYLERQKLSRIMKISAIHKVLRKYKFKAFMVGIRWDEHESRSSETYFSPREDHLRVHPILHFTEKDIWDYVKKHRVPFVDLYKKGYRSLGEKLFTFASQPGQGERSGRERGKELVMKKLRKLGYW